MTAPSTWTQCTPMTIRRGLHWRSRSHGKSSILTPAHSLRAGCLSPAAPLQGGPTGTSGHTRPTWTPGGTGFPGPRTPCSATHTCTTCQPQPQLTTLSTWRRLASLRVARPQAPCRRLWTRTLRSGRSSSGYPRWRCRRAQTPLARQTHPSRICGPGRRTRSSSTPCWRRWPLVAHERTSLLPQTQTQARRMRGHPPRPPR
mmetsp:Transcript_27828/g.69971  ORF Transcript_27828/g.69971 Transcript_27828/m.69971 type:complete len:201 (-) Transcript_27828:1300-1902(-)